MVLSTGIVGVGNVFGAMKSKIGAKACSSKLLPELEPFLVYSSGNVKHFIDWSQFWFSLSVVKLSLDRGNSFNSRGTTDEAENPLFRQNFCRLRNKYSSCSSIQFFNYSLMQSHPFPINTTVVSMLWTVVNAFGVGSTTWKTNMCFLVEHILSML